MPNDAKLGLLVGAVGVLLAAVMYGPKGPAGPSVTAAVPRETVTAKSPAPVPDLPPARAAVPTERPLTPSMPAAYAGAKTKPELDGTPVARKAKRGE